MRVEDVPTTGGGVWYLASPYTHYGAGWDAACEHVAHVAALLLQRKVMVFSPITHSHPIGKAGIDMGGIVKPDDLPVWEELDRPFMEMSVGCIVVMLPGWQNSTGTANEVRWFVEQNKPILYLEADDVSDAARNAALSAMLTPKERKLEAWPEKHLEQTANPS